ncbi:hypothetical protein [Microbulbifer sp. VAAF005]|uniref:hypothetical protein n=1 Tax=Microbulbifer sp. VAAF005 TaxID=3034230 RepID=UPI0024ADD055|nr:hypothetical protein [Microbulbifer sp. VAAF005]WHI48965.1 hypothetical protein P0078_11615 [Microbulbifer sp. VAAF005]
MVNIVEEKTFIFVFSDLQYECSYNEDYLTIDAPVYIVQLSRESYDVKAYPVKGADRFSIQDIENNRIYLCEEYSFKERYIDKLLLGLGSFAEFKLIIEVVNILCQEISSENYNNTEYIQRTPLDILSTISNRLDMVSHLYTEEVCKGMGHHHEHLVTYLMLTCFERLGQARDWMAFGKWLSAKRTKQERKTVIDNLDENLDSAQVAEHLHTFYNKKYGVRSAFFRFFEDRLDSDQRSALLSNIEITKIKQKSKDWVNINTNDDEKLKWLYSVRNRYTHQGLYIGGNMGSGIPTYMHKTNPLFEKNRLVYREQSANGNNITSIALANWPEVLIQSVKWGSINYLLDLRNS